MKKLFITLLAAITVSGAVAQDTPFPDIPAGHWASDAVERIADLGIVIGFPDGTFRGNESFTRYQVALVVSRLLDVINANAEAAQAMTDADIASLRNAVQELAADVAAQGATVAAISDDVAANTARIETLEDLLTDEGIDPRVFADLQNQLASLRVAVDTAQARAEQALRAAQGVEAQVDQNTADIAVLEELVTILNQDLQELIEGGVVTDEALPPITGDETDIANIREFVILLRRDQVALRQRVNAIEDVNEQQDQQLADLDARVTTLEENAFTFSGSLTLSYNVGRLSGDELPFDVDRIWGLNNEEALEASAFSTGSDDLNDDGDETDVGEVAQDREDIDFAEGEFDTSLSLTFAFTPRGGVGPVSDFEAVITLGLREAHNLDADADQEAPFTDDYFSGYVFVVDELSTTFTVGTAPISIQFGQDPEASFTPYVFDASGDGFVVSVGAPDFLAFLDPTLTFAYGRYDRDIDGDDADDFEDAYYRGARLTLSPIDGFTIGGSFAQMAEHARENADAAGDNEEVTVYGVDAQIALSIFDLQAEYAQTTGVIDPGTGTEYGTENSLVYAILGVDGADLPIIESIEANYRDMPVDFDGLQTDDEGQPFVLDQTGFGVEATLDVFIIELTGYYDSYTTADPAASVSAYGADATLELFSALELTGFYHTAMIDGVVVDDLATGVDADETVVVAGVNRNDNWATEFGVELSHDGEADNALIPGLNLGAGYIMSEADFSVTTIFAEADFDLTVSVLTLSPYARYEIVTDTDTGADDTTTLMAGAGLETEALDVPLAPSLIGAVNYRTTAHTEPVFTASELQWSAGLQLNEFLFADSVLTARYGSWTGTNINDVVDTQGDADTASDISGGDVFNSLVQSTSGYEIAWAYLGLEFAYGAYLDTIATTAGAETEATGGQEFSISYTIDF